MYLRAIHAEDDLPTLHSFVKNHPLGILTTSIQSSQHPVIQVSHIPWILDEAPDQNVTELGVLRGHMARQNPQSKALIEAATAQSPETSGGVQLKDEVLVLFNGPVHHYVTPKFYTETKPATGKVVPTWDYSAVQAYGKATVFVDRSAESTEFLSRQLDDLSNHAETDIMGFTGENGSKGAWKVTDAPDNFISLQQKAIIGIRIDITRLDGKFKMSQEMKAGDRAGVAQGFEDLGTGIGRDMAQCVLERERIAAERK